jgi:hypothetical protein
LGGLRGGFTSVDFLTHERRICDDLLRARRDRLVVLQDLEFVVGLLSHGDLLG